MNDTPVRIRVRFSKLGDMRFTGHIDLQRLFERALRRSGLPIRYSQGFAPKVRLNLASALPLGYTGKVELLDFWMNEPVDAAIIQSRLTAALPRELPVNDVWEIPNNLPSLQSSLLASEFVITFPEESEQDELEERLGQLLSQDEILISRREKTKDFKQMILLTEWLPLGIQPRLKIRLTATPAMSGRPDDLVTLLGLEPADCDIERTKLIFDEEV